MTAVVPVADGPPEGPRSRIPVGPRMGRAVLLFAAFVCAACGLVYELALLTLGSYLVGDTVRQASLVLSVFVFSMGVGALASKRLRHRPALGFAVIEAALALTGGLSVLALYAAFAWLDLYQPALLVVSFVVGGLVGAEIPVLMTLLQQIRPQEAGTAVADLSAADYVGALVGGLAFPFLLLPRFGQLRGALVGGMVNAAAAALVAGWLFRPALGRAARRVVAGSLAGVILVLGGVGLVADRFEVSARQALFDDPIVHREQSGYQEIVLTESLSLTGERDLRLFLDGDLQFSSVDEYRYSEALVHPAMAGRHEQVLVLGGGDGLAAREVLRYPDVRSLTLVELDPAVVRLARDDARVADLNGRSLADPRVEIVTADAFDWLREGRGGFDVIVADFPDPESTATAKLYSQEFYAMAASALSPSGRLVVQAGSPAFARQAFWCIDATVAAAGLDRVAYHVDVPSFGDWGFVLAGRSAPALELPRPAPDGIRSLDTAALAAAAVFPPDRGRLDVDVSTLTSPRILDYERAGWRGY